LKLSMEKEFIKIRGAKVHNLKNINLDIPKNKLVVICGVSGSGKSSLAFDTLYAEGQRRYVESLSTYARQFLGVMQKPDVDKIEGISPAISIDQRKASHNPRSTVGTMTEIYDYLRVLFARVGVPHCPKCQREVKSQTIDQITEQVLDLPKQSEILVLGPLVESRKGTHKAVLAEVERGGFVRVRLDGVVQRLEEALEKEINRKKKHSIEVVVDRLILGKALERSRLVDSLETALRLGRGKVLVSVKPKAQRAKPRDFIFSEHFSCEHCGISLPEIEPRLFSFNSPYGACPTCQGLGKKLEVAPDLVIPNKNLSIAEGAIFPWARASHKVGRQSWFWRILERVAHQYNFSLYQPAKDLDKRALDIILYGDGFFDPNRAGAYRYGFEGVVNNLERRYWQTESEAVREEIKKYMRERQCEACSGRRLREEALAVKFQGKSIDQVSAMSIIENLKFFQGSLSGKSASGESLKIAEGLFKEIVNRLQFLIDVGLDYLTLSRETGSLSGGEEQRTRLATQIGSKLSGVLYILDEPSVGLHPRDQGRLINTLKQLRDANNTVVVVEHDNQTIKAADWVIEIGPGAGKHGGRVIFTGSPKQLLKTRTLTGDYLAGREKVSPEAKSKKQEARRDRPLVVKGAKEHNLKDIDVKIPLGRFICVTGVSGSGKSSLVNDIIARALYQKFYHSKEKPGEYREILGVEYLNKVVLVDQSPIGRTPRSNPATYTGAFTYIRDVFSKTREAKIRGYKPGRFSFNVKTGRCEACEGQGVKKIEMYFLPDVYVSCEECKGKRYNKETLEIEYKGKNIAQVLDMTVEEAMQFFKAIPPLHQKLKTLNDVGLSYIELGQGAPSLSGGEAQRVKLATELSKQPRQPVYGQALKSAIYILDEPTTGLHADDIKKLLFVLRELVNKGNTVLAIEHNIDFIKGGADWVIDLGPEGGDKGGRVVAQGTVQDVAKCKASYTSRYLK